MIIFRTYIGQNRTPETTLNSNIENLRTDLNTGTTLANNSSVTHNYASAGILVVGRKNYGYKVFAIVGWEGVYLIAGDELNVTCTVSGNDVTITNNSGGYVTYCFMRNIVAS